MFECEVKLLGMSELGILIILTLGMFPIGAWVRYWPSMLDQISEGRKIYDPICAVCHMITTVIVN